jgi:hypothetical protein
MGHCVGASLSVLPNISEIQRLVDDTSLRGLSPVSELATVIHTLLCYVPDDGFELYAVVDGPGGNRFAFGESLPVTTVSKSTPLVKVLLDAWIGEAVPAGTDLLLVAGKEGMPIPPASACAEAVERHKDIARSGSFLRESISALFIELRRRESELNAVLARFSKFDELQQAVNTAEVHLAALRDSADKLHRLSQRPSSRSVETIFADVARETEDLRHLRTEFDDLVTDIEVKLIPWRAFYTTLDAEYRKLASVRAAERNRVYARYIDAMRDPSPIGADEASVEYREIQHILGYETDDADLANRRLRTLRLRCLHSISKTGYDDVLEWLLDQINLLLRIEPDDAKNESESDGNEPDFDFHSSYFQQEGPQQLDFDW